MTLYDAIVIGGGHNGLVCAATLAHTGRSVLVLERRFLLGGACSTESVFKGCQLSRAAYVLSLFHPQIIQDLELKKMGLTLLPRNPSSISLFSDQRSLVLGHDDKKNYSQIQQFSTHDADHYQSYTQFLETITSFLNITLDRIPFNIPPLSLSDFFELFRLSLHSIQHPIITTRFFRFLRQSATGILDQWFESSELKGVLATDSVIGAMASPNIPGTGYVLCHHVMGRVGGSPGVWAYVKGGMGGLTDALHCCCLKRGVDFKLNSHVDLLSVDQDSDASSRVKGVVLKDGTVYESDVIISNLDPYHTFVDLVPEGILSKSFLTKVKSIDFESPVVKLNLHLSQCPKFNGLSLDQTDYQGTIHLNPSIEQLHHGFLDAQQGRFSTHPLIEITLPSILDQSLAPPGQHVMGIFSQYAPVTLKMGDWQTEKYAFAKRIFNTIESFAPGFQSTILDYEVLAPPDLESIFGLKGGNIFHGAMTLNQLYSFRPVRGYANYATPLNGLFLCGSGTHPGGGVTGIPGWNAARYIISHY